MKQKSSMFPRFAVSNLHDSSVFYGIYRSKLFACFATCTNFTYHLFGQLRLAMLASCGFCSAYLAVCCISFLCIPAKMTWVHARRIWTKWFMAGMKIFVIPSRRNNQCHAMNRSRQSLPAEYAISLRVFSKRPKNATVCCFVHCVKEKREWLSSEMPSAKRITMSLKSQIMLGAKSKTLTPLFTTIDQTLRLNPRHDSLPVSGLCLEKPCDLHGFLAL